MPKTPAIYATSKKDVRDISRQLSSPGRPPGSSCRGRDLTIVATSARRSGVPFRCRLTHGHRESLAAQGIDGRDAVTPKEVPTAELQVVEVAPSTCKSRAETRTAAGSRASPAILAEGHREPKNHANQLTERILKFLTARSPRR